MSGASFYQDTNPSIASIQSLVDQAVAAEAAAAASASMAAAAVAGLVVSGGGSISVVINKTGISANAMTVFQDTTSGRARCGLIGDDTFHIQTSGNGSSWVDALTITTAGVVAAATATGGTNTTQVATTQFVQSAVSGLATTSAMTTALALKAPLASPALTGTPTAPTAAALTNNTQLATTSYTDQAVGVETTRAATAEALKAPLASPALTGTPTAPTATPGDNTTKLATTAFVAAQAALLAPLASPTLTGTPAAPTAAPGTSTTQLATTAFVRTGVTDGSNAAAGVVGEYLSSSVAIGSEVSLATTVANDCTSLALTAGDWDVTAQIIFDKAASTVVSLQEMWIGTASATIPTLPNGGAYARYENATTGGASNSIPMSTRVSVNAGTTLFLSTKCTFSTSTLKVYGFIGARRAR